MPSILSSQQFYGNFCISQTPYTVPKANENNF